MAELTVYAAYYASDSNEWLAVGDPLNKVEVLRDPDRIECTTEDGELLFSCELFAECDYQTPSEQFHQWAGIDGEAYGLSFATVEEAEEMRDHVYRVLDSINHQQLEVHPVPSSGLHSREAQVLTSGMPEPLKFPITRRELLSNDDGWRAAETHLRLTYPSRLRSGLQIMAVTELAREQHIKEFESRYSEYAISDLWLAVNDVTAERVGREGLQALGANMLSVGVPLGVYLLDRESLAGTARQMVLCKVVLARSMPITESTLGGLREASGLPVGYQSFAIVPSANQPEDGSQLPTNCFEHLYLVPQPSLVLMTHSVKFDAVPVNQEQNVNGVASPAMSLLATHPEVLSAQDRESIFAVCSPVSGSPPRKSQRDLSHAIDLSYRQMWDELRALVKTQKQLELNLTEFRGSLCSFQDSSWSSVQGLQDDMVKYLGHSSQVLQAFRDRKFEINRTLSDIARFQELFMYTKRTCSVEELLCSWRHLRVLFDSLDQEIRFLASRPQIDESLMALTERNKKVISLNRNLALQDELIDRLSERLEARGIMQDEDLQLIC